MMMNLPWDNKSSCEREVMLAPGQSLPWGSSLSQVRPCPGPGRVNLKEKKRKLI